MDGCALLAVRRRNRPLRDSRLVVRSPNRNQAERGLNTVHAEKEAQVRASADEKDACAAQSVVELVELKCA